MIQHESDTLIESDLSGPGLCHELCLSGNPTKTGMATAPAIRTPSFVLIYFPPSTSEYRIDCKILTSCLHSYNTKFASMSYQCGFGEDYILYILGDFNFPEIDWITLTSSNTNEQKFIETSDLLAVNRCPDS